MAFAAAAVGAGTLATAAYLDAKFHFSKDLTGLKALRNSEKDYQKAVREDKVSPWYIVESTFKTHWNKQAVWSRDAQYTFGELYENSVRYATWLLDQGVKPGDLVAVYMLNSPEFLFLWYGMHCIGAAPAFLNYNLEGKALLHCLSVCETKLVVVDQDPGCQKRIEDSKAQIEAGGARIVVLDSLLKTEIAMRPVVVPGDEYRNGTKGSWPFALIYTSGTTGLPKGCAFTIQRTRLTGTHLQPSFGGVPGVDCWYNNMPMYHGTGGLATAMCLMSGIRVAIAPKFSVSRFWDDIYQSQATFFVYVGETARYLLNAPPHPLERKHKLRCAYGNGLRPDIWAKLQQRFNIPEVAEFFNSTEGVFALIVWSKGPYLNACVGHHGLIMRSLLHNTFIPVMIDHDTGDIWRDPKTGFAKRMPYVEGGEMIVKVPNKAAFQGYWRSPAATDKKFCQDVFKKGDLYYRSGDALRREPDGKWYFLDRLGDTYRWKSENVSTAEVAECIGRYPGVAEANVYGVLVPNHEGRAGCAALHIDPAAENGFNYTDLLKYMQARLPRYAVPVFLRVVKASTHIHNNKQNKVPLRKEGVEPKLIGTEVQDGKLDQFLWIPPKGNTYIPFNPSDWDSLQAGKARL